MGQALPESSASNVPLEAESPSVVVIPSLFAAVVCSALIAEAIVTVLHARSNGDMMVMVCPILGAMFMALPTARAWWKVLKFLWES
jgi:hypothetical protein